MVNTVTDHFQASLADRNPVTADNDSVVQSGFAAAPGIEINEGFYSFIMKILVKRHCIMSCVEQNLIDMHVRKESLHCKPGSDKRHGIVPRSGTEKRKDGKIPSGSGIGQHVEAVSKVKLIAGGIPADVTVRLGVITFSDRRGRIHFTAPFPVGSHNRRTVTGKSQMFWINQTFPDRYVKKQLMEDAVQQGIRLVDRDRCAPVGIKQALNGHLLYGVGFLTLSGRCRDLLFRHPDMGSEIPIFEHPEAGSEIVKRTDARDILRRETAQNRIERGFMKHADPLSEGSYPKLYGKEHGTKHTGREPWLGTKVRVTISQLHDGTALEFCDTDSNI